MYLPGFRKTKTLHNHQKPGMWKLLGGMVRGHGPDPSQRHVSETVGRPALEGCSLPYCESCALPYYDGG